MSMPRHFLALGLLGTCLGWVGCSSSEVTPVTNDVSAVLRGSVTRQNGSGVPGTQIAVAVYPHRDCTGSTLYGEPARPVGPTGAGGVFGPGRFSEALTAPFHACLVISADPPDSTGLKPDTVSGIMVDFRDTDPLDTAVVNFTVAPK